ncbi:hypothetical protein GBF38_010852 [Nibea albiflora]|uniref:Uncharacterized protein n=1 Tax=Nibea albiflora TaxID=240163 RepID=A0ACB7ES01_NIBAL|nr:hypothetical protein GBF38_010852 [Nibea albiflora]
MILCDRLPLPTMPSAIQDQVHIWSDSLCNVDKWSHGSLGHLRKKKTVRGESESGSTHAPCVSLEQSQDCQDGNGDVEICNGSPEIYG